MTLKEEWNKLNDFGKFMIGVWIFIIIMFILVHIFGSVYACYGLQDFAMDLMRGGNVTAGC